MTTVEPTVFIVDDDQAVLHSFLALFSSLDLPVETFSSGRKFLQAIQPGQKGCAVIDLRMPDMDGLELLKEINQRSLGLAVIIITAEGTDDVNADAMAAGALVCLPKPVNNKTLMEHVRQGLK